MRLQKYDWLWAFAYPLYQVVGTARHEAFHALVAWWQGATITKFVIWPGVHPKYGGWHWGYISWEGGTPTWLVIAAPYLGDTFTFMFFFGVCWYLANTTHHAVWLNMVILGLISPFVNSIYAYQNGLNGSGDIGWILRSLPNFPVHLFFVITLTFYLVGIFAMMKHTPQSVNHHV